MRRRQARTSQGLTAPALRGDHGESRPASALTRRGFLALLAAAVLAPGVEAEIVDATLPGDAFEAFTTTGRARYTVLAQPVGGWFHFEGGPAILHGSERVISRAQWEAGVRC